MALRISRAVNRLNSTSRGDQPGDLGGSQQTADDSGAAAEQERIWRDDLLILGSAAVIGFELLYLAGDFYLSRTTPVRFTRAIFGFHLFNVLIGVCALAIARLHLLERFWKQTALIVCVAEIAGTLGLALGYDQKEPLFLTIILFMLGTAACVQWEAAWQAALNVFGLLAFALSTAWIPAHDPFTSYRWFAIVITVLATHFITALNQRHRLERKEKIRALDAANEQLAREVAMRERVIVGLRTAESELQSSETKLRRVFEALADPIAVVRVSDYRFMEVNDSFAAALGYRREHVIGRTPREIGIWETDEQLRGFARLAHKGAVRNYESNLRCADGAIKSVLISSVPFEIAGEACLLTIVRDISERKQAEQRLQGNEARLRKIFEASLDTISLNRVSDGRYMEVSETFTSVYGYRRDQVIGKTPREIKLFADDRDLRRFAKAASCGVVRNFETDVRTADGGIKTILMSSVPAEIDGELCILSFAREITERKEAERQLQRNEAILRKIFSASLDPIIINRLSDGRYLRVSQEFLAFSGYSEEQCLATSAGGLGVWAHNAQLYAYLYRLRSHGHARNFEFDFRKKDGNIVPCLVSANVVELNGEQCIVATMRNFEDRKRLELELVAARESAIAAAKAKSEFLSSMSHEIRTPMNAVMGIADLIAESELSPEQRRFVELIRGNARGLLELIDNILDLAKAESGQLDLEEVDFDLGDLIEQIVGSLAIRAHSRGLELASRIAREVPLKLVGDPLRLRQVLFNLLGNAIKFTEKGEVVLAVEIAGASQAPGGVGLNGRRGVADVRHFCFSVSDTGIGILPDQLNTIFSSFTQADSTVTRKYGGSGLGLAIVKRLADLMGGSIVAESKPGHGSVFRFTAPLRVRSGPMPQPGAELAGMRILVVDDTASSCAMVCEMAAGCGAHVGAAGGAAEALAQIERAVEIGEPWRIVLLDCRMPEIDGFRAATMIRARAAEPPTILMLATVDEMAAALARVRKLGLAGCLSKPVRLHDLMEAIAATAGARPARTLEPAAAGRESAQSPVQVLPSVPLRILLVEDSGDNRMLIETYLRKTFYRLDEAENGRVAIEKFKSGAYDLVLMDMQLPEVDGYTATRSLRQWEIEQGLSRTPIVALTASVFADSVRDAMEAGCDNHINKPVTKTTLLETLRGYELPVDLKALKELRECELAADGVFFRGLIERFLTDMNSRVAAMKTALVAGDANALSQAAHGLRGSCGYFGARRALLLCSRLEWSSAKGSIESAGELLQELEFEADRVRAALEVEKAVSPVPN